MHLSPCWPRCPPALLPTDLHINQPSMGACAAGMSCWPWEHRLRATHHPPASKTGVTPTGHQGSLPTAWRWRPQVATATRSWQSLAPHTTRCPPARFALPSHHIPLILTHSSHPITFIRDSILSVPPSRCLSYLQVDAFRCPGDTTRASFLELSARAAARRGDLHGAVSRPLEPTSHRQVCHRPCPARA